MVRIGRTSDKNITLEQIVDHPAFKYLPPTRKKFVNCFVKQTVHVLLIERDINSESLHINPDLVRLPQHFLKSVREEQHAHFVEAVH